MNVIVDNIQPSVIPNVVDILSVGIIGEDIPIISDIFNGFSLPSGGSIVGGGAYIYDNIPTLKRSSVNVIAPDGARFVTDGFGGLGPELVVYGDFSSSSGWNVGTGWSIAGGVAISNTPAQADIYRGSANFVPGRRYRVSYTINSVSGTGYQLRGGLGASQVRSTPGTFTEDLLWTGTEAILYLRSFAGTIGEVDNLSVTEILTLWDDQTADDVELYENISIETASGFKKFFTDHLTPSVFKRCLIEPVGIQFFKTPQTPATHTTSSMGVGAYTLWCEGGTSVEATAGTAVGTFGTATPGNPVTITITTAGTVVLTVNGAVTRGQLESGAFKTSQIDNGTTTTTRTAVVLSAPTDSIVTTQCGLCMRFIPNATGQTGYLWSTYTDANNYVALIIGPEYLILRKRISGINHDASIAYAHASGVPVEIICGFSGNGLFIKCREFVTTWGEWTNYGENADGTDAIISATYQIGGLNSLNQVIGHIPFVAFMIIPDSSGMNTDKIAVELEFVKLIPGTTAETQRTDEISIALFTDAHYSLGEEAREGWAVAELQKYNPNCAINCGDTYDGYIDWSTPTIMQNTVSSMETMWSVFSNVLFCTGNHDHEVDEDFISYWGCSSYADKNSVMDVGTYRFINFHTVGAPQYTCDAESLLYLETALEDARIDDKDIILMTHCPLIDHVEIIEIADILSIISTAVGNGARIRAVLSGHWHYYFSSADFASLGIPYYGLGCLRDAQQVYMLKISPNAHYLQSILIS